MSLFKARDWWSTSCAVDEEFDKGCLCISNIDNSPDGSVKIIVGSYGGFLRIYKPQPIKLEGGAYSSFRADELLLEAQLNSPIFQVEAGRLVSSTKIIHLAILHPFKLAVYTITAVLGTVDHGTYYNLSLMYEHILQRHAFSMVLGPFGGIRDKDLVCVQSLDGTLNFFEQESFAFSRFLPNSLLPGPIAYVRKSDSFVTISGFSVESYRFQALAVAKDDNVDEDEINKNFKGKKVAIDWSYNIGEGGLDIITITDRHQPGCTILVLGERTLFALTPSGTLKFAKKFNFTPSCMMAHNDGIDGSLIITVATTNQTLLIYNEKQLKWAALLSLHPVCMRRATFTDIKGLLVLLSAQGNLACCYLGTEPSLFVSPMIEPKEIDFEDAEKEMQQLRNTIKSSNQNLLGTQHLGNEISLTINMPHHADNINLNEGEDSMRAYGLKPSVTVKIHLKCSTVVHDVRLMIHVEPPLKVAQNIYTFGSVVDYSQAIVTVTLDATYIPSSLKFVALAAYTSSQGTPRIFESSALLPFTLVAKTCAPAKNAEYKITVDINKKVIPASELFSDLSPDSSSVVGGAMGIEYYGGQQIAIMPSKSAQRYRLQSDVFPSLWLILSELVRRLKTKYKKDEESTKLICTYSSPMPLQEVFAVIEEHFDYRQQVKELEVLLGQRAEQFRVVQKRLLTKMKDKTPTPLNNLDTLLEATHRHALEYLRRQSSLTWPHSLTLEESCFWFHPPKSMMEIGTLTDLICELLKTVCRLIFVPNVMALEYLRRQSSLTWPHSLTLEESCFWFHPPKSMMEIGTLTDLICELLKTVCRLIFVPNVMILSLTESLLQLTTTLENSNCSLSSAIQLLLLLLKLSAGLKDEEHTFVSACFSPYLDSDSLQGWEESLNVALTYILKFCLGKAGNDLGIQDSVLEMPKDISKLKKHLTYLFDQLSKNESLNINGSYSENDHDITVSDEDTLEQHLKEELMIPVGSKFADNKELKNEEPVLESTTHESYPMQDLDAAPPDDQVVEDGGFSDYPDDGEEMII